MKCSACGAESFGGITVNTELVADGLRIGVDVTPRFFCWDCEDAAYNDNCQTKKAVDDAFFHDGLCLNYVGIHRCGKPVPCVDHFHD